MAIREPVYTSLIPYFYTNLAFEANRVRTRVLGRDIDIPLDQFANLLHLSCEGVDVYSFDLHDFEYPAGESPLTASTLLHGDDNPGLVRNEEVNKFTLTAQVLAKFVFYNILPKSGEYSHARGYVPLIVYCLLKGIKINFARFIITHMTSDHVCVPSRHLPYGMLISYLLKQLDFDLSSETPSEPSVNLNNTLLKRMHARVRLPAPEQPPIPPAHVPGSSSAPGTSSAPGPSIPSDLQAFISSELRAQFQEHQSWVTAEIQQRLTQFSAADAAHRAEMDSRYQGLRNDMSYFVDSMRYMDSQFSALFAKYNMLGPDPTSFARPLPSSGPPFPIRAPSASSAPQPGVAAIDPEEEVSSDDDEDDDDDEDVEMAAGEQDDSSEEEDSSEEDDSADDE